MRSTRLVSFTHRAVAAIAYEVEAPEDEVRLVIQSELAAKLVANELLPARGGDPRVAAALETPLRAEEHYADGMRLRLVHRTARSNLRIAVAADHIVQGPESTQASSESWDDVARLTVTADLRSGQRLRLEKLVSYAWSGTHSVPALRSDADAALAGARSAGWQGLVSQQREFLDSFWRNAEVEVEVDGDAEIQQAAAWRDAANAMTLPYNSALGIHEQSRGFTSQQAWNFAGTGPDDYPLMLHFPYFDLYRKQVIKQADLVLAMFLFSDAFDEDHKPRNFAYYEALTVRDSSLSACVQSLMAAEVGQLHLAYDYLGEAALMDLDDLENNTRDGLHVASLAGAWIALVAGFGGMRYRAGVLHFAPRLPEQLTRLAFSVQVQQRCLRVEITGSRASYTLAYGEPLQIRHCGEAVTVSRETVRTRLVKPSVTVPEASQPPGRHPQCPR